MSAVLDNPVTRAPEALDVQQSNPFYMSTRDGPSDEYLEYLRKLVVHSYQTLSTLQLNPIQAPAYRPWADTENLRFANEIGWLVDAATALAEEIFPDLGIDPEPYRWEAEGALEGAGKLRLVTFPLLSWTDALVFRFVYGLVIQAHAEATIGSNYIPYAVVAQKLHFRFGTRDWPAEIGSPHRERLAQAIAEDGIQKVQQHLDTWWGRALDSFGQAESPNDITYRRLGLKTRSNAFTRRTFETLAGEEIARLGLRVPTTI